VNWLQKTSQQQQRLLVIARGPSGSGKSRMTEEISEQSNAPIFSSDDFWMINGEYQFDREYVGESHFWNQGRVEEAMQGNTPVIIVDNTNSQFWEMKPYVLMAQKYGYNVDFKEPDWHSDLKTPEGQWNVDFLEQMQNQPDREKVVPRDILENMVGNYDYNPTVESVLRSERSTQAP